MAGGGESGSCCLMGTAFFKEDEKFLRIGWLLTTVNVINVIELYTDKWLKR